MTLHAGKTTLAKGTVTRFNMEKTLLQRDIVPRRARTQNGRAPPQPYDGTREMPVGVGSARPSSVGAATGAWRRLTRCGQEATRAEQCHPASLAAAAAAGATRRGRARGPHALPHCPTGTRVERRLNPPHPSQSPVVGGVGQRREERPRLRYRPSVSVPRGRFAFG